MIRALVVAVALVAAACGDRGSPAEEALDETEANLSDIRSGVLEMTFLAAHPETTRDRGVGFAMSGRFAVARDKGSLPVADLEYTRITGDDRRTTSFISTGRAAFVEVDGRPYRLTDVQVDELRRGGTDEDEGGLAGLNLGDWIRNPRLERDSGATDRLSGSLDAVAAINDILSLALTFGADDADLPRRLEGDAAERIRRAVRESSVTVVTGRDNRLLRRADVRMELSPTDQERLRDVLGRFAGVELRFEIAVEDHNRPVTVEAPGGARPIAELSGA